LEDVLHQPRSGLLSKADYYAKHLFLRVLYHTLAEDGDEDHKHDPLLYPKPSLNHSSRNPDGGVDGLPRTESPETTDNYETETDEDEERAPYLDSRRGHTGEFPDKRGGKTGSRRRRHDAESRRTLLALPTLMAASATVRETVDPVVRHRAQRERRKHARAIERLKSGARVDVKVHPLCIFLLRNGTVITIARSSSNQFASPIVRRLQHRDTSLRLSADPALLVHAVLDLVVDRVFAIVDAYQSNILALEHRILLRPQMFAVQALHILQQDLAQHKRTLEPIRTVVYGLRRYDADRAAALVPDEDKLAGVQPQGFMSHKAKIYLADVVDHMDYVLASLEMFSGTTENLINYTFNVSFSILPFD
jgi:Mg2+ and Co2+ transporter CorA